MEYTLIALICSVLFFGVGWWLGIVLVHEKIKEEMRIRQKEYERVLAREERLVADAKDWDELRKGLVHDRTMAESEHDRMQQTYQAIVAENRSQSATIKKLRSELGDLQYAFEQQVGRTRSQPPCGPVAIGPATVAQETRPEETPQDAGIPLLSGEHPETLRPHTDGDQRQSFL